MAENKRAIFVSVRPFYRDGKLTPVERDSDGNFIPFYWPETKMPCRSWRPLNEQAKKLQQKAATLMAQIKKDKVGGQEYLDRIAEVFSGEGDKVDLKISIPEPPPEPIEVFPEEPKYDPQEAKKVQRKPSKPDDRASDQDVLK